ncbi:glycoside hydrolase family 92 protein [Bacteroides salyersiae]|nr:glycoside hydrolase family 92 protein [Bacteroides salyersiae]
MIADAYMKGIRNYDIGLAYEALRKNAMIPPDCDTQRRYGDRDY